MNEVLVLDPINRFVWTLTIVIVFICSIQLLKKSLKSEILEGKYTLLGFSVLLLGQALTILFVFINDYFIYGSYKGHSFYGDVNNNNTYNNIFGVVAYSFFISSFIISIFLIEKGLNTPKHYFTFMGLGILVLLLISIIIGIIYPINYILLLSGFAIFFLIIIKIINLSHEEFQPITAFFLIGFIIYLFGLILNSREFKSLGVLSPTVAPILILTGAVIGTTPTFLSEKIINKRFSIWFITSIIISLLLVITLSVLVSIPGTNPILYFILFCFIVGLIIDIYSIYLTVKNVTPSIINVDKWDGKSSKSNYLKQFLKPAKIEIEEVTFLIDHKICLICRKEISKLNYICPKCKSMYCSKCIGPLTEIENACWVCQTPIDDSKPVNIKEEYFISKKADKLRKWKKVALVTIIDDEIYKEINNYNWEPDEKEEFIEYMLSLSPQRRNKIIKEIIETTDILYKKD